MDITNIILFLSIVNFVLTLFVFLNAQKSRQHISFLVFSFITTIWLFDNFLLRIYPYSTFGPLSYGLGILVAMSALIWVYHLVDKKVPKAVIYVAIPLSVITFFVASFTEYVVSYFSISGLFGYAGHKGSLFSVYSLFMGLLIGVCLYELGRKSMIEQDAQKKRQIFSIFIGAVIFGLLSFMVDFFMPLFFDIFDTSGLVTITYSPLLIFIVYSMTKHKLFGIKILITQLLVAIFLSLLFLNFLLSGSVDQYVWNGVIFAMSGFLSYLIVKSMFKEIEFDKKLLEETQRNLDLEKRISSTFAEIADQRIKKIEEKVFSKK